MRIWFRWLPGCRTAGPTAPTNAAASTTPAASASTAATTASPPTTQSVQIPSDIDPDFEAMRSELYEGGPLPDANYYDHDPFLYDDE